MKAGLLITGSGTLIYLTSHKKFMDEALIEKFESKGIETITLMFLCQPPFISGISSSPIN